MKSLKTSTDDSQKYLAFDIGGSNIKATLLDETGDFLIDYRKLPTPVPASPEKVLLVMQQLAKGFPGYDKISAGFPGYVKSGTVMTAPNLSNELWKSFPLSEKLGELLGKPAKVVNDADMQGLGIVKGKGLELVITLGTGFGTALFNDGILLPHLEISHHPVTKTKDYDMYIGDKALAGIGKQRWNQRMMRVFAILKIVFNYDHLYIGGGNSDELSFPLDDNMTIVTNKDGIKGGVKLWQQKSLSQ